MTEDKVFDYLKELEETTYNLYKVEKGLLEKFTRDMDWDKVIKSAIRLKILSINLNLVASMIEAHECGDI